jgi:hypothetical protein
MTTAQSDLLALLQAENAYYKEGIESGRFTFACGPVEDLEHWAESGVHCVEDYRKYNLATDVYEGTKSVYGYKPNWKALMNCTLEELEAESVGLLIASCHHAKFEAEQEAREEWLSASVYDRFEDLAEAAGY